MDTLLWIAGIVAALATALFALPGGMAVGAAAFSWLRDSKLAQGVALTAVAVLGLLALRRDARKQGAADALRDVQAATERAVESKRQIDRQVERTPLQRKRNEMGRWSK